MVPYAGVDYNLILCPLRVDSNTFTMGNPMPESTLSPSQGLCIWPRLLPRFCGLTYISMYLNIKETLHDDENNGYVVFNCTNPRIIWEIGWW